MSVKSITCPHGKVVEARVEFGVTVYYHDDGTPCSLFNSLSNDAISQIFYANMASDHEYIINPVNFGMYLEFGFKKFFELPLDLKNFKGILLNNMLIIAHKYQNPTFKEKIKKNLGEINMHPLVRAVALDIFIRDVAMPPIPELIKEFPEQSRYVSLYAIQPREADVYFSMNLQGMFLKTVYKWLPLIIQHRPIMASMENRLDYIFNVIKFIIKEDEKSNIFEVLNNYEQKVFIELVKEMKMKNYDLRLLYNLSSNKRFKERLNKVVYGGNNNDNEN